MASKAKTLSFKIIVEIILGIFVVAVIGLGIGAYMISNGSISIDRAIPYVQNQLNQSSNDIQTEIGTLTLEWQGLKNPLGISAQNVVISNDNGPFLFAPKIDMDISIRRLLIGEFQIESLWLRQLTLSITKNENGEITLTGQRLDQSEEADNQNDTASPSTIPTTLTLNNLIHDLPPLDVLWLDQARLVYRDNINNKTSIFDPVTFFIEMDKSEKGRELSGFVTFPFGQDKQNNIARLNFQTHNDPLLLRAKGEIQNVPIDNFTQFFPPLPDGFDFNMVVNSNFQFELDNLWSLHQADLEITGDRGQILFPLNDKDDHIDLSDTKIHITHDPKTNKTHFEQFSTTINDQIMLTSLGDLKNINNPEKLSGSVNLTLNNVPQSYFSRYWPVNLSDNGAYRWLVKKMDGGEFEKISLDTTFDLGLESRQDKVPLPPQIKSIKAMFEYDGVTVDYKPPFAKAEKIKGSGEYNNVELTLNIDQATIGGMTSKNATLHFDDLLTRGVGTGTFHFPIAGETQPIFDFIASKPIEAFKSRGTPLVNTKGQADLAVDIILPLTKDTKLEDVKVTAKGTVNSAKIPNAVKGLTLSGGPFNITATTEELKLSGQGQLDTMPLQIDWHEYFSAKKHAEYLSKIIVDGQANTTIRRAFTNDFSDYFDGTSDIKATYTTSKNAKDTVINLDVGLTHTKINAPEIGFIKKENQRANATLDVHLRNGHLTHIKNLRVKGESISLAKGDLKFAPSGDSELLSAQLKNIAYGDNRLSVDAAKQNDIMKINITGAYLDAQPFLKRDKKEEKNSDVKTSKQSQLNNKAREIGIDVLKMRTGNTPTSHPLSYAKAYIKSDRFGTIGRFEMDSSLGQDGNSGDLNIRYTPDIKGGLTLRVESNNAGETLRAFDLYPYIKGGQLQIAGTPITGGRFGDVKGRARINNFEISNAPILLRLINALSFQNFLQAGNLGFTRLESDFEWLVRDRGDIYTIADGRTSGASVALTFDGVIDTEQDNIDIQGTAAPLSQINKFIGKIPLIGTLLTGGEALLAATYTIDGPTADPSVNVNPLSVLAPGIIRKLIFEGDTPRPKAENRPSNTVNE